MNSEEFGNFEHHLDDLRKEIKDIMRKRNQLNNKIKKSISSFQSIESEIYKSLFKAKEFYNKKKYLCNKKINQLRHKAMEAEMFLDYHIKVKELLKKPKLNERIPVLMNAINYSIKDIEYKIDNLTRKIKFQILDIDEENNTIEKISTLEKKKQKKTKLLSEIEQKLSEELFSSDYYKTNKKIELLEINLNEIYKNLNKWSNKRRNNHIKMLALYRKARDLGNYTVKMEKNLRENKQVADQYYQTFLDLMSENKKPLLKRLYQKPKEKPQERQIITPRLESIIEKKKQYKKFLKEKLAIALDKQKSGKKMNFYELKLILDHSKK